MAENDVLGISGQMDISDIQQSFDKLIGNLNALEIKTNVVSSKMTKALNDIAQSSASDSEKTKQSVQTLKDGIDEINKSLATTPDALKKLASEVQNTEATIDKLKTKLSETVEGSQKWNEINEQLKSQQTLVEKLNNEYSSMSGTFDSAQQYIGTLNTAIETLNAGRSISSATTGASAAAHVGAAAAVGTEAVAHGENSAKIAEETEKTQENTQIKLRLTESTENYVYTAKMEAEAIDAVAKRLIEGKSDEEEYINSKKSGMEARESLIQKIEEEKRKIMELSDAYSKSQDANNGVASPDVVQAYNDGVKIASDNIKEYRNELAILNQSLNTLDDNHAKAQRSINEQADATQNLKKTTEEAKEASEIYFGGEKATIEGVTEALRLDYQALKQLKAEYATLKGAGDIDGAKKNLEEQKELNKHIAEGRDVLKQLGTTYEDSAQGAKKAKEETKDIGKEAENATKKVGGIFSKIKGAFGGAIKGDFSGLFSMLGKFGAWGAALVTVGKGLHELTIRAEEFRNALQPLSHYLDKDTLQDVRQNILALSDETGKSLADMASAATQFVKTWDGLRSSSEALTTMIKSSNEFGVLAGKTSEESAKFLSILASEYHMTAQESTEASDVIATASHNSTSNFGEMADAISSAGSTAALYGVSFKEMATLIGYSSNQFGSAQKAASKFSMLLMSMSKMQDKYNPSVVGMITALQNLKKAYDNGEHVENKFMARQRSAALYFIKNAEAIAQYSKGIDNNKAKQELLNDANARASTNVAKLQNAWNGFLTSINANLTPTLTRILKFFTKIIGGAQRTADELNYLKNYDNNHKGAKKGVRYTESVTGGWTSGFRESTVANMGASQQYNGSKEEGLKLYQKQRDKLKSIYQRGLKAAQKTWKNASSNAYANSAGNYMLAYYNKHRSSFSEFTPQLFNEFLRNERNSTKSLLQKPNNTDIDLGGNNYVPKPKKDNTKDKRLEAQEAINDKLKKLEQKNIDDEIALQEEGTEKKLAQIDADYKKRLDEINKQETEFKKKNKEAGLKTDKDGLTSAQINELNKARDIAKRISDKKIDEVNKEALASMRDYLKEYGSLYQQKQAIAKEYEEKIAKAQTEGDKLSLQQQKNKELQGIEINAIRQNIDWGSVFGDFGAMFKDQLEPTIKKLQELSKNTTDINEQKTIQELISKLQGSATVWDSDIFKQVSDDINVYQSAMRSYIDAQKREEEATKAVTEAQKKLAEAKKGGNKDEIKKAEENLSTVENNLSSASNNVKKFGSNVQKTSSDLQTSTQKAVSQFEQLASGLQGLTSGSLKGIGNSILSLDKLFGGNMQKDVANTIAKGVQGLLGKDSAAAKTLAEALGDSGMAGEIISAMLDILDILKDGFGTLVSNLMDTVFNAVTGILDDALSGDIVMKPLNTIRSNVSHILNTLSFGGFNSLFGSNAKEVAEKTKELTESNERLQKSVDNLKNELSKQGGFKAISTAKQAEEDQKAINQQTMGILQTQMGYHGAHHSNAYKWGLNVGDYASLNQTLANYKQKNPTSDVLINSVNSLADIYKLTPEQMQYIQTYNIEMWEKMLNQGDYDKSEYWEKYADLAGKLEEITESLRESLTGTTFDNIKSNFINSLMDMTKDAQDFSDNFSEMLMQSVLNAKISDMMNDELQAFYKKWADYAESDNILDDSEISELKKEWQRYVQEGMELRDQAADITGYNGTSARQKTSSTGSSSMTYEQVDELNGRFTALQIAGELHNTYLMQSIDIQQEMSDILTTTQVDISDIKISTSFISQNISEMLDIQYESVDKLTKIATYTSVLPQMNDSINNIYNSVKDINRK